MNARSETPSTEAEKHTGWLFPISILKQFPSLSVFLLVLLIANTFLAGASAGVFLPAIEILLNPEIPESSNYRYLSFILNDLTPNMRLMFVLGGMVIVFAVKFAVQIFRVHISKLYSERCRQRWVSLIADKYFYAPLTEIKKKKPGTLSHNLIQEPLRASRYVFNQFEFIASGLAFAGLFLIASIVNWKVVAAVAIGFVPVFFLYRKFFVGLSYELGKQRVAHHHAAAGHSTETLINLRDVKVLSIEDQQHDRLMDIIHNLSRTLIKIAVFQEIPRAMPELLGVLFFGVLAGVSTVVYGNRFQAGIPEIAFFMVVFLKLLQQVSLLMACWMTILTDQYSFRLMEKESQLGKAQGLDEGESFSSMEGDVQFENVSFEYAGEQPVIEGLNMTLPAGKLIFLAGPSGSGKSTIVDLLARFLETESGKITIRGKDISKLKIGDWRRVIGYVSQECHLFHGTILENILLASPGASLEEATAVGRAAGIHDFISRLPQGYDTTVAEQGDSISGGQRKRIAIARALIRNPSMLILDEVTSSFELNLETEILGSLRRYPGIQTIIVISHRLESAREADLVFVINKGKVIASGSYEQVGRDFAPLVAASGTIEE